jgi:5-methylcytosine-specific restriction protein A
MMCQWCEMTTRKSICAFCCSRQCRCKATRTVPKSWNPPETTGSHRQQVGQNRGNANQRGYNRRWRKARITYLKRNPVCVMCEKAGQTTAATVVDHIKPHRGDGGLFWDASNWQALCARCHNRKTGRGE